MVQIPTARDVAGNSARSGRIANAAPSVSVASAMGNVGKALTQVAYDLNDLRTQEGIDTLNKRSNDVSTAVTRFQDEEERRFLAEREKTSESGIGFTRQFMEGYQQRADAFAKENFEGLSDEAQTTYLNNILSRGNSLYEKAHGFESERKKSYYDLNTNKNLDTLRTQINANAAPFEDLKAQGLAAIDATNMDEQWKAARRASWENDAAESKVQFDFKKDPAGTISKLKAPAGGNEGRAYQRLISKGWTPAQAAGIVGNLSAESGSGLNTQARNPGDGRDGSDSIGIAQWNGSRARALKQFAAARGTDWHDIDTQIDFVDHELRTTERTAGENLARSTNAEEAAAAFVGYERPAGWSPGNARGAMHWEKRRDAALRIAGASPSSEDPVYDNLSYDSRMKLLSAAEGDYAQQRTQQRTIAKDNFSLLIATQPQQVKESVILNDPTLDNGDKATLITSLRTAVKERNEQDGFLAALASGGAFDPFDTDQRKQADGLFKRLADAEPEQSQPVAETITEKTGIVPQGYLNRIRGGSQSTNPSIVEEAGQAAARISQINPAALARRDGGGEVQKLADDFGYYVNTLNLSPADAAKRIAANNDPDKARQRKALEPSVKDFRKVAEKEDVADIFDDRWLSDPELGFTPMQAVGMQADFLAIAEEQYFATGGDPELAVNRAKQEMKRLYGVTDIAGRPVVMKHPPEKYWPAQRPGNALSALTNDPYGYAASQLADELKKQSADADINSVQLVTTPQTDAMIKRGELPAYQVLYRDQNGVLQTLLGGLWRPDTSGVTKSNDDVQKNNLSRARDEQVEQRDRAERIGSEDAGRGKSLDEFIDGPVKMPDIGGGGF